LFRSVGYRGIPIAGVPFDEKPACFRTSRRILSGANRRRVCTGRLDQARPVGIGTNKPDAFETAKHVLADFSSPRPDSKPSRNDMMELLASRNVRVVSYPQWRVIDAAEVARGAAVGKPREKFVDVDEMVSVAARS
jgi:ferredoxin--NADP+ reductase